MPSNGQSTSDNAAAPPLPILTRPIDRAGPTWRLVLSLAWPVLLQQSLMYSVILSDSFLAGHFQPLPLDQQQEGVGNQLLALGILGGHGQGHGLAAALAAEAPWTLAQGLAARQIAYQAALTTAYYMSWFIVSYTILVSVGSTALVARLIGAGDRKTAIHATNQSILLAAGLGLLGTIGGLVGLPTLVRVLQLRGEAGALAVAYLQPLFSVLVLQIITTAGIACLVGAGDTRTGSWVLGLVTVLNVPLAWGFFHGLGSIPRLGFAGIALGTAISQAFGGLVVLTILARGRAGLRLRLRLLWPDRVLLARLLRVGVPAGIDSLSGVLCQLWFLSIVNRLGDTASSAHGIALRWEAMGYLSGSAFGTAAMTLVGQNLGAGLPAKAARSGWVAFGLGCGMMCLMGTVFYILAPQMFALFCASSAQRPIIEAGVPVLRLVAFAMPATASYIIFTYALRAAGDTRVPVLFTWIGFLGIRIPLTYLLTQPSLDLGVFGFWPEHWLGLYGAWLAMFADLLVRGSFFLIRFASGRWQKVRV